MPLIGDVSLAATWDRSPLVFSTQLWSTVSVLYLFKVRPVDVLCHTLGSGKVHWCFFDGDDVTRCHESTVYRSIVVCIDV